MNTISSLYKTLKKVFDYGQWRDRRHLDTFCQMVSGLIQSESSNLTHWIPYVIYSRAVFAQSKQRRFIRWLTNHTIEVETLYAPMIKEALAAWGHAKMYIVMDTSLLWNQFCLISISVVYRGRAVPIIWKVVEQGSSMIAYSDYAALLKSVPALLPKEAPVVLLADRGFADTALMALCRELDWHFRIRVKENYTVYQGDRKVGKVADYALAPGKSIFLHNVSITHQKYGPVHLALAHPTETKERWSVLSDEPTSLHTYEEYGFRFDIEELFLDEKSNGFNVEHSALRSEKALTRLFFVLAATTLYLVSQGTQVVADNKRRHVDPHWFRGSSYLRIGWNWIKAHLSRGWQLLLALRL